MNRSYAQRNIESLTIIAHRLEELLDGVTFVGGCITGLLITDKAAPDVRFTVDVDCIINVITKSDYYTIADKLRQKGFKEIPYADHPICRWDCDGILVDVMPVEVGVLGFSNRWYKEAQSTALEYKLSDAIDINIISAPYFLATKLEAFKERGQQDFLMSHDLEDIIALIDGREEIITDIQQVSDSLKQYLAFEMTSLMSNPQFLQALPGHLNYSQELEHREEVVKKRIFAIMSVGK